MDTQSRILRSRLAAHSRYRPEDTETAETLRRELRAARLEEYIRKTVDAAPALTSAQRESLAALLSGPTHNGGVAA